MEETRTYWRTRVPHMAVGLGGLLIGIAVPVSVIRDCPGYLTCSSENG